MPVMQADNRMGIITVISSGGRTFDDIAIENGICLIVVDTVMRISISYAFIIVLIIVSQT